MKSFWASCLLLVTLFCVLQANVIYLAQFVSPLQQQLEQAARYADAAEWEIATALTRQVQEDWHDKSLYLHVTLRHDGIDQVYVLLEEVLAYLEKQEIGEYAASNAALINRLGLLYEMEQLTLKNIL